MKYKHRSGHRWRPSFSLSRVVLVVFLIGVGLFLLALVIKPAAKILDDFIAPDFTRPGRTLSADQPLNSQLFFNDQLGTTIFSDVLLADIDKAQYSLEIAMYSFKSPVLRDAVYRAAGRGVAITLILDWRKRDVHDQVFTYLPDTIKRLDLGSDVFKETVLMHHKFAIIDRGYSGEKLLFGSYNWTELQEKYDPSFLLRTDNRELIASFGREFDRLAQGLFGPQKLASADYRPWDLELRAGDYRYEVWFSPGDRDININRRILHLIREAKQDIKIMVWNFTDRFLAEELIAQARAGLKVTIIADNYNYYNAQAVFLFLEAAARDYNLENLLIIKDDAREAEARPLADQPEELAIDPFLHHHLLIVDDRLALFGTNNWSRGGAYFNDESIIVTDDPVIVSSFLSSFNYNYRINR